jgi:hypothetical protein
MDDFTEKEVIGKVIYNEESVSYQLKVVHTYGFDLWSIGCLKDIEIIGNMIDSGELLVQNYL